MNPEDKIILALDVSSRDRLEEAVELASEYTSNFKLGLESIYSIGPKEAIEIVKRLGGNVFLDVKLDDIPNTLAQTTKALNELDIDALDVHISSGEKSVRAVLGANGDAEVYGVTVLTSITDEESEEIFGEKSREKVKQFAKIGERAGLDGIVCSPNEIDLIQESFTRKVITPGIRPEWASSNDQSRTMTPREALSAGADFLVIGRPITDPPARMTTKESFEKVLSKIGNK